MSDSTFPTPRTATPPAAGALATWWKALCHRPAPLNLALQGGGAHGAFTWGVLDALLEDPRLRFEGLSGSSAGAMNAVVMAHGWLKAGRDGARRSLAEFWGAVGRQLPASLVSQGESDAIDLSSSGKLLTRWASYLSPAQLNPFHLNPLRDLLERLIDFEQLRVASPFKLFVGTTHARSGRLRVFREHELPVDVLLASACLPKIHHAIEIDGETYWDGGYAANPAVFPLFCHCKASDVLLVLLDPLERDDLPGTVEGIAARVAELGFSTHFMREMCMFAQATALARASFPIRGRLERRLRTMRFHMIDTSDLAGLQHTRTKLLAYSPFLERLHADGRDRGTRWLSTHAGDIGRRSTIDLDRLFG